MLTRDPSGYPDIPEKCHQYSFLRIYQMRLYYLKIFPELGFRKVHWKGVVRFFFLRVFAQGYPIIKVSGMGRIKYF